MIKVGVIGATGYAGAELVRLLLTHPDIAHLSLSSTSFEGGLMQDVYPNLIGRIDAPLVNPETLIAESDLIFAGLPHGVGEGFAQKCADRGIPYIDLSADFRFGEDEATFTAWYAKSYAHPDLHKKSVYGLPEFNRLDIQALKGTSTVIIGNPGCYPTGASLGLYPALKEGLAGAGTIIIDAASGVSGAGRSPTQSSHFPDCSDALSPYKVGSHRHVPEIARNLAQMAGKPVPFVFTPHLAPMNRGILSTMYVPLAVPCFPVGSDATAAPRPPSKEIEAFASDIRNRYASFYKKESFVRVLPYGQTASTRNVRASNYCDISIHLDQSGSILIVVTAIDNMVKGAAGQAIQNMNLVMGFDEKAGLDGIPAAF